MSRFLDCAMVMIFVCGLLGCGGEPVVTESPTEELASTVSAEVDDAEEVTDRAETEGATVNARSADAEGTVTLALRLPVGLKFEEKTTGEIKVSVAGRDMGQQIANTLTTEVLEVDPAGNMKLACMLVAESLGEVDRHVPKEAFFVTLSPKSDVIALEGNGEIIEKTVAAAQAEAPASAEEARAAVEGEFGDTPLRLLFAGYQPDEALAVGGTWETEKVIVPDTPPVKRRFTVDEITEDEIRTTFTADAEGLSRQMVSQVIKGLEQSIAATAGGASVELFIHDSSTFESKGSEVYDRATGLRKSQKFLVKATINIAGKIDGVERAGDFERMDFEIRGDVNSKVLAEPAAK